MPKEIARTEIVGHALWGGKSNPYFVEDYKRNVAISVSVTADNHYIVSAKPTWGYGMPLYQNVFDSEPDARADANRIWQRISDGYSNGEIMRDEPSLYENGYASFNVCPQCDHVNTLNLKQEAYGDRTTCSNCDYDHYYSIGD